MTQPNFINEIGNKYGKLTVIKREQNTPRGTAKWLCQCECGNTKECRGQDLRSGRITHCGCENKPKKITNYFKIKNMSIDEMANFLRNDILYYLPCSGTCEAQKECQFACLMMMREYLLQEVEE